MARLYTNKLRVNCSCGISFLPKDFVREPVYYRESPISNMMWERYCPNCNQYWGASPISPEEANG